MFVLASVALEEMYDVPERRVSSKPQRRVGGYLGTDNEERTSVGLDVKEFYDGRSASVHRRRGNSPSRKEPRLFEKGFDIARRTLFKLLREDPPKNWKDIESREY